MANKISNVPYDQIPHIVINHPDCGPEHQVIMRLLFKILKDKPQCVYSNKKLSIESKIPDRTLRRRLDELEKFGFIIRKGNSYNRRFSLGLLFNTTATMAAVHGSKLNTAAKTDRHPGHGGQHTNPFTNINNKRKNLDLLKNEYHHDMKQLHRLGLENKIIDFDVWLIEKHGN